MLWTRLRQMLPAAYEQKGLDATLSMVAWRSGND